MRSSERIPGVDVVVSVAAAATLAFTFLRALRASVGPV
jgi:hypothetical protein